MTEISTVLDVRITDFEQGTCDFSGKDSECFRVRLSKDAPEALISVPEFVKQLRFAKKQEAKRNGDASRTKTPE